MNNIIDFNPKPELNVIKLKQIVPTLKWTKKIRKMGSISQIFYSGIYENEDKKIHISVRPSMMMRVIETFKNRDTEGRAIPEGKKPREIVNFGSTVEIRIDQSFLDKIASLANDEEKDKPVILSWSD